MTPYRITYEARNAAGLERGRGWMFITAEHNGAALQVFYENLTTLGVPKDLAVRTLSVEKLDDGLLYASWNPVSSDFEDREVSE